MNRIEKALNVLIVLIICCILLGAYGFQIIMKEQPCPLCMLQRLGMIGIACGSLLNIAFGSRRSHYALSLLASITGGSVALRQISLHVCPQFPTFGTPIFGLNLYTWSFIIHVVAVFVIALLLLIFDRPAPEAKPKITTFDLSAFVFLFLITSANVVTTLIKCGLGPCTD